MTGAEFKAIRMRLGLTAEAFARALGYSGTVQSIRTAIYMFQSGRREIPPAIASLVAMIGEHGIVEVAPPAQAPKAEGKSAVEELIELGERLYGPHWINPLSRDLGIAHRTIAAWVSGKSRFREGPILDALRYLVKSHAAAVLRARQIAKPNAP
jgi:transcriptional regulator with XRE-family HTH domain